YGKPYGSPGTEILCFILAVCHNSVDHTTTAACAGWHASGSSRLGAARLRDPRTSSAAGRFPSTEQKFGYTNRYISRPIRHRVRSRAGQFKLQRGDKAVHNYFSGL